MRYSHSLAFFRGLFLLSLLCRLFDVFLPAFDGKHPQWKDTVARRTAEGRWAWSCALQRRTFVFSLLFPMDGQLYPHLQRVEYTYHCRYRIYTLSRSRHSTLAQSEYATLNFRGCCAANHVTWCLHNKWYLPWGCLHRGNSPNWGCKVP